MKNRENKIGRSGFGFYKRLLLFRSSTRNFTLLIAKIATIEVPELNSSKFRLLTRTAVKKTKTKNQFFHLI